MTSRYRLGVSEVIALPHAVAAPNEPKTKGADVQPVNDHSKDAQLTKLGDEHRALKGRLHELDKHIALTSAERVERAQLKKLKLRAKDEMLRLQQS